MIADVAKSLDLACLHSSDNAPWESAREAGHYSSEWVMVARGASELAHLKAPPGYDAAARQAKATGRPFWKEAAFWSVPKANGNHLWTDKGENSYRGLYRSDPEVGRLRNNVYTVQGFLMDLGLSYRMVRPVTEAMIAQVEALDRRKVREKNAPGKGD